MTFEPVRSRLLQQGARVLFDSSMIPSEIVDVLAVHESVLETSPAALHHLLAGWFAALDHLGDERDHAGRCMAARLRLSPEDALASLDGLQFPDLRRNVELVGGDSRELAATAIRLAETMLAEGLLRAEQTSMHELFDAAPLERLLRERPAKGSR